MTSRDFAFWLQGVFEVGNPATLSAEQVAVIRQHLDLVFNHDPNVKRLEHPVLPSQLRQHLPDHWTTGGTIGPASQELIAIC